MTVTETVRSGRDAYRDALVTLMRADERVVCLDSDTGLFNGVGFGAAEGRYVNLGIAEQNMMGVAAGLARSGRLPVVNTMATFAATRALESVKVDIALTGLPVRIVATHGGLSAGHLGPTHHSLEDLAVMRVLPNMTVVVPADAAQVGVLFAQCVDLPGPSYLRLGRNATPDLPADVPAARLGVAQPLRPVGGEVTVVACGPHPVLTALAAADELERGGVRTTVLNMHTVKPLDVATLAAASAASEAVVTVEEHWAAGGLGSAVSEALAELAPTRVVRVAVPDRFVAMAGGHEYLLARMGIEPARVVDAARKALARCGEGERR